MLSGTASGLGVLTAVSLESTWQLWKRQEIACNRGKRQPAKGVSGQGVRPFSCSGTADVGRRHCQVSSMWEGGGMISDEVMRGPCTVSPGIAGFGPRYWRVGQQVAGVHGGGAL